MSVVLVIAVGLFFLRDNIAKFINNAATQIAGEESDGKNEYGFYFDKAYFSDTSSTGYIFHEDGSVTFVDRNGNVQARVSQYYSYSNLSIYRGDYKSYTISSDGKNMTQPNGVVFKLQE